MKIPKRTKQVTAMIEAVNDSLKSRKIRTTDDSLFLHFNWLLLTAGCYAGFSFYHEKEVDGVYVSVPAHYNNADELEKLDVYVQFL